MLIQLCRALLATALVALLVWPALGQSWTHYAGDAARTGIAPSGPRALQGPEWSVPPTPEVECVYRSAPVVYGGRVFVNAWYLENNTPVNNLIVAYDSRAGGELWRAHIDLDVYDSWSSPAVDRCHQTVIVGSGQRVHAVDVAAGGIRWQTALEREIVNASPAVSEDIVYNGTPANRVFITDYGGFGNQAKLYGINVDPYDAANNPYEPGDIAWTADLPGASGNSPAYADGTVYIASRGGFVYAFRGIDGALVWETQVNLSGYPQYTGFYGGVTVRNGYVYAATYVFYGQQNNSPLFKLDARTGAEVWNAPAACERTDSVPIVTDDGRIYLAGGIDGFGSAVKIRAYQDHGTSVSLLWDTYQDSGGTLVVGGWTHQPVYANGLLYTGRPDPQLFFGPYVEAYVLDTTRHPSAPGFVVSRFGGTGGSPAIVEGNLYSLGTNGLTAFSPWKRGDMNCDGKVDFGDINPFVVGLGNPSGYGTLFPNCRLLNGDINGDGRFDFGDINPFVALLTNP